jgi:CBS domain-containing protein
VGADRALKRLGLNTLAEIELVAPNGAQPNGDTVALSTTVRDALSLLLSNGGRPLTVLDLDGDRDPDEDGNTTDGEGDGDRAEPRVAGLLTLETVSGLLDEGVRT